MDTLLNHWFFYFERLLSHTIFSTLVIYGVIVMLFIIMKKGWIMKNMPIGNHLFHLVVINTMITAVYIYTLPIKPQIAKKAHQVIRTFDKIDLTVSDSIVFFFLYFLTLLVVFWLCNKIMGWLYTSKK